MPMYCLKCDCGWWGTFTLTYAQREQAQCPDCHKPAQTDIARQGPPSVKKPWEGSEARSVSMGVMPHQIAEATKRVPSAKYCPVTGDAIYESDEHQRRCFREEAAAIARETDELAAEIAIDNELAKTQERAPAFRTDIPQIDALTKAV